MMDKLSPDERAQAAKMQENMRREMQDMQHVAMKLKPSDTDPDAPVSNFVVLTTLATSPLMAKLGETADESVLDKLEELIVGFGSLSAGQIAAFQQENAPIIRRNVTLLKMSESSDATLLQKLEEIVVEAELLKTSDLEPVKDPLQRRNALLQKLADGTSMDNTAVQAKLEELAISTSVMEVGALDTIEKTQLRTMRRNILLLYWHLHRSTNEEFLMGLEDKQAKTLETQRGLANQLATTLLVRSQMLMPRQRWVQPTLAIARASALIATALWSHTDEAALALMAKHLQDEDSLPMPKLSLAATAEAKTTSEIVAGTTMNATVKLTRQHAAIPGEGARPACNNEQGIYEAYWLYIEGIKPEGTPNSLIAAKPMVVKNLEEAVIVDEVPFVAPPAGTYTLRVHVLSTSVIGVELTTDVTFTVEEDDVPALQ
jgi:hypothetical protein